jgi:hypothetical protein
LMICNSMHIISVTIFKFKNLKNPSSA